MSLRFLMFCMALLILGATDDAQAQAATTTLELPRVEVFGGYSYLRTSTVFTGARVNLHGASLSAAWYLKKLPRRSLRGLWPSRGPIERQRSRE